MMVYNKEIQSSFFLDLVHHLTFFLNH